MATDGQEGTMTEDERRARRNHEARTAQRCALRGKVHDVRGTVRGYNGLVFPKPACGQTSKTVYAFVVDPSQPVTCIKCGELS